MKRRIRKLLSHARNHGDAPEKGRSARLALSVMTAAVAKATSLLLQLIALPLAARTLAEDQFHALVVIQFAFAWVAIPSFALPMTVGLALNRAIAANDEAAMRRAAQSGALLFAGSALIVGAIGAAIGAIGQPEAMIGVLGLDPPVWSGLFLVLWLLATLQVAFTFAIGLNNGFQAAFVSNVFVGLGSLTTIGLIVGGYLSGATLAFFALAILGTPAVVLAGNLVWSTMRSRALFIGRAWDSASMADMARGAFWPTLTAAAGFVKLAVVVPLVAHLAPGPASEAFGTLLRMMFIIIGFASLLITPSINATTDAISRRDLAWAKRILTRQSLVLLAVYGVVGAAIAVAGSSLVRVWLGLSMEISVALQAVMGVYMILWVIQYITYPLVFALRLEKPLALGMLIESGVAILVGAWLTTHYGPSGMAAAMVASTALILFPILALALRRAWRNLEAAA